MHRILRVLPAPLLLVTLAACSEGPVAISPREIPGIFNAPNTGRAVVSCPRDEPLQLVEKCGDVLAQHLALEIDITTSNRTLLADALEIRICRHASLLELRQSLIEILTSFDAGIGPFGVSSDGSVTDTDLQLLAWQEQLCASQLANLNLDQLTQVAQSIRDPSGQIEAWAMCVAEVSRANNAYGLGSPPGVAVELLTSNPDRADVLDIAVSWCPTGYSASTSTIVDATISGLSCSGSGVLQAGSAFPIGAVEISCRRANDEAAGFLSFTIQSSLDGRTLQESDTLTVPPRCTPIPYWPDLDDDERPDAPTPVGETCDAPPARHTATDPSVVGLDNCVGSSWGPDTWLRQPAPGCGWDINGSGEIEMRFVDPMIEGGAVTVYDPSSVARMRQAQCERPDTLHDTLLCFDVVGGGPLPSRPKRVMTSGWIEPPRCGQRVQVVQPQERCVGLQMNRCWPTADVGDWFVVECR